MISRLERLLAMTTAIAHRGPDDEHFHLEPGVALGARRLAIIDLAGGQQPLSNEDRSIWVAFNGELFEYPELRRKLLASGHHLATRCDTEAWVHLYEEYGPAMFEKTRGQFAVSLWDRNTRTLILGRDRVGICPLYYTQADGWLLWGSEITGSPGLGTDRRTSRRSRNRPLLHVLWRRDDPDVLRGRQVVATGAFSYSP